MKHSLPIVFFFALLIAPIWADETDPTSGQDCCSHHRGVACCDIKTGRVTCNDGVTSGCTCEANLKGPGPDDAVPALDGFEPIDWAEYDGVRHPIYEAALCGGDTDDLIIGCMVVDGDLLPAYEPFEDVIHDVR